VSGIVEECVKLAAVFKRRGLEIDLDLGYDILWDSEFFGRPRKARDQLPGWVNPVRVGTPRGYSKEFVKRVLEELVRSGGDFPALHQSVREMALQLSESFIELWKRRNVRYVIVENGSVPDNLVYTHALRRAIVLYGQARGLERFVIWRDHDLTWIYQLGRYGDYPYSAVPRPLGSPYVVHVVTNRIVQQWFEQWGRHPVEVLPSYQEFLHRRTHAPLNRPLRRHYGIPVDACLIARCSRIVPQKRIDREIETIAALRRIAEAKGSKKEFYLFITGLKSENAKEVSNLQSLARERGLENRIIWGNGLASFRKHGTDARASSKSRFSVRDLLFEADISSFLTSYASEGYGLPPSEAIATGIPFTSSTYEVYDGVYGTNRYKAPLYEITAADDSVPGPEYHNKLFNFLLDPGQQREYADANFRRGRKEFSLEVMDDRVMELLPSLRRLPCLGDGALTEKETTRSRWTRLLRSHL
jgi:glycosyltransferase involved in cell wall biosynthesis